MNSRKPRENFIRSLLLRSVARPECEGKPVLRFYSGAVGRAIELHICATGLLSKPRPSFGCLKWRPIISRLFELGIDTRLEGVEVIDCHLAPVGVYHLCLRTIW